MCAVVDNNNNQASPPKSKGQAPPPVTNATRMTLKAYCIAVLYYKKEELFLNILIYLSKTLKVSNKNF